MNQIIRSLHERKSVRVFTGRKISEEDVRTIRGVIASLEKLIPAPKQEPDALAAFDSRRRELDILDAEEKGENDYGF